jgi:hypothetical protein
LKRHRRRGVDGFWKDEATSVKRIKETDDSGDGAKNPRRVECSERRGAFDQGNLGLPHSREIKLCLSERYDALSAMAASKLSDEHAAAQLLHERHVDGHVGLGWAPVLLLRALQRGANSPNKSLMGVVRLQHRDRHPRRQQLHSLFDSTTACSCGRERRASAKL